MAVSTGESVAAVRSELHEVVDVDGFVEPRRLTSVDGVLQATITASSGTVTLGDTVHPGAINLAGAYMGPTLDVWPGDVIRLKLVNDFDEPINLHFHGLHVSPKGNSDNVFLLAKPGESVDYEVHIPAEHSGGLNWYHSHIHQMSHRQIDRGFFGMIHIDGGHTQIRQIAALPRRFFGISHLQLDAHGVVAPTPLVQTAVDDVTDSYDLVNGVLLPHLTMRPGAAEYWHVAGFAGQRWYEISLPGFTMLLIAEDGNPLRAPKAVDSLLLSPAKRYEVIVIAGETGDFTLANAGHDVGR